MLLALTTTASAAEVGIASTFYDRSVACAPLRIDPYKTWGVAHKTLPCGTMLWIRARNREVLVPVVDRGPCTTEWCNKALPKRVRARILDLLPPVAKALRSSGLIKVTVEQ